MSADAARAVIEAERRDRRAMLALIKERPGRKLAERATAMLLDYQIFDDKVAEVTPEGGTAAQGRDNLTFLICADVSEGLRLEDVCMQRALHLGMVKAMLSESDERMALYRQAQAWVADADVAETVALADDAPEDKYGLIKAKLKIDTRFRRAESYDGKTFGREKGSGGPTGVAVQVNITRFSDEAQAAVVSG